MTRSDFFIFDWPEEETNFVKDYCNSFNLEEGAYQSSLPLNCKTAQESLDTSHWTFKEKLVKPFDSKIIIFDSSDDSDDKMFSLVERMARRCIPEFKDVAKIVVKRSAVHYYPENNGFMGWHTNANYPAWRIYLTYTPEADKSYISYYNEETREEVRSYDKMGITCRAFKLEEKPPLMHCVFSQTQRWSLGFKIYNGELYNE